MRLLAYLFRNSPYIVLLAMVSALVSGLSSAMLITLIHQALNSEVGLLLGGKFAALVLVSLASAVVSQVLLSYLYRKAVFDWQIHLSREILRAPLRQLEEVGNGALLSVLIKDVTAIGSSLLPILPLCTNVVVVMVCLGYLCWLSWQLFLGTLLLLLVGAASYKIVLSRGQRILKQARAEANDLYDYFRLMTDGIRELKLHQQRRHAFLEQNLKPKAASIQQRFFRWSMYYTLTQTWSKFLLLFLIGIIVFVFPSLIQLETNILVGYVLTLLYIRAMLLSIVSALPALANADIAFQNVAELGWQLKVDSQNKNMPVQVEPFVSWSSLELINLSHIYYHEREDRNFILGPIDLKFKPGELVFLVGGNGSGKSTLAKLLSGLYTPKTGQILLNDILIDDDNRERYRQLFSVVFSDFQLFEDLFGLDSDLLNAKAHDYLVKLQLEHKVQIEQGRLSTIALSGGQRQRLALLTAYLEDRPFYIFDEWAANQDPIFKEIFYTQFLPELRDRGKTVLVITHDDKYYDLCDRLIELDAGRLVTLSD